MRIKSNGTSNSISINTSSTALSNINKFEITSLIIEDSTSTSNTTTITLKANIELNTDPESNRKYLWTYLNSNGNLSTDTESTSYNINNNTATFKLDNINDFSYKGSENNANIILHLYNGEKYILYHIYLPITDIRLNFNNAIFKGDISNKQKFTSSDNSDLNYYNINDISNNLINVDKVEILNSNDSTILFDSTSWEKGAISPLPTYKDFFNVKQNKGPYTITLNNDINIYEPITQNISCNYFFVDPVNTTQQFQLIVITSNNTYTDSYIKGINVSAKLLNIDGIDYDYNIDMNYITFNSITYDNIINISNTEISEIILTLKNSKLIEGTTKSNKSSHITKIQSNNKIILNEVTFTFNQTLQNLTFKGSILTTNFREINSSNDYTVKSEIQDFTKLNENIIKGITDNIGYNDSVITNSEEDKSILNPNISYKAGNNIFTYNNVIDSINFNYSFDTNNAAFINCKSDENGGYINILNNTSEKSYSIKSISKLNIQVKPINTLNQEIIYNVYNKSSTTLLKSEFIVNSHDFFGEYIKSYKGISIGYLQLKSDKTKNYDYNIDSNYITFNSIKYDNINDISPTSIDLLLKLTSENNIIKSTLIKSQEFTYSNNTITISNPTFNFTNSLSGSFTDVQLETTFIFNNNQQESYINNSNIESFSKLDITLINSGFDFNSAIIQNGDDKSILNPNIFYSPNKPNIFSYSNIIKGINYEYNNNTITCLKSDNGYNHITNNENSFSINPPSTIPINSFSTLTQQLIFSDDIYNKSNKAVTGGVISNLHDFFGEYFSSSVKYEPKFLNINSTNYQYDIDPSYITILNNEITGFIIPDNYNYLIPIVKYINNNDSVSANPLKGETKSNNRITIPEFIFPIGDMSPIGVNASIIITIEYTISDTDTSKRYDIKADNLNFSQLDQNIFLTKGFGFDKAAIINNEKALNPTISYKSDENIFNYNSIINNILYTYSTEKANCNNNDNGGYNNINNGISSYTITFPPASNLIPQIKSISQEIEFENITNKGITTPIKLTLTNDTNLYLNYINQFTPKVEVNINPGLNIVDNANNQINYDKYMSKANQKIQLQEITYTNITEDMDEFDYTITKASANINYIDDTNNDVSYLTYIYTSDELIDINKANTTYQDNGRIFSTLIDNAKEPSSTDLPNTKFYLESTIEYTNSNTNPPKIKLIKSNKSDNFMKLLYYDYTFDFDKANIINTVKHTDPDPDILIPEITVKSENNKENLLNTYICQSYNSSIRQLLVKTIKYTYNNQSNYVYTKNNSTELWKYIESTENNSYIIGKGECI